MQHRTTETEIFPVIFILAAGLGSRFGGIKPLAKWGETTLLDAVLQNCLQTGSNPIYLVLGHQSEPIRAHISTKYPEHVEKKSGADEESCDDAQRIGFIYNQHFQEGMASSIRTAVSQAIQDEWRNCLLICCDQPLVSGDDLKQLINQANLHKQPITCASYDDTFGIPAVFDECTYKDLLCLQGDKGAKPYIALNRERTILVPIPSAAYDVDQPIDN